MIWQFQGINTVLLNTHSTSIAVSKQKQRITNDITNDITVKKLGQYTSLNQ